MNYTINANKTFYILFAVSILLLFLLFSLLTKTIPLTISHSLYYCKGVIAGLGLSLPHSFPSLFILGLLLVLLSGLILLVYQVYKTKNFVNNLLKSKINTPKKVEDIALKLGIAGKVVAVKDNSFSSFCYGLIFPEICLSLKLVNSLTNRELKAVLLHESYHFKNRDPLKVLLSQIIVSMFFFVPILRDFHKYYTLSKEINADQLVINNKFIDELKSALTKTLANLTPGLNGIASFASANDLEDRVNALTNPYFKTGIKLSILRILISILVFISAFGLLNLPISAMDNGDGTHSYYVLPLEDEDLVACTKEESSLEFPFSSQSSFTSFNYSPAFALDK